MLILNKTVRKKILCFISNAVNLFFILLITGQQNQWRTQEFFSRGGSTNSVEDRGQNGDLGCGSPLVRGSGGICNLVQEIPFHIVKLS